MTYVALSVDWQRTERRNGSIRWNDDKTVRSRVVKIGWKWNSALRREWDGVRTAHSHLWAWEELTSNRHDLCPPRPLTSSISCCPSQPQGDTTAHITSIAWFELIHPLKVSRPLSHLGHVGTTDRVWRSDAVCASLLIPPNPTLVVHQRVCEIPLEMPVAMQTSWFKQRIRLSQTSRIRLTFLTRV